MREEHVRAFFKPQKRSRSGGIKKFEVIRIADEIIVDVMSKASGISYEDAEPLIEWVDLRGVKIPFASAELLFEMKQGIREKDKLDRLFLERLLFKKKKALANTLGPKEITVLSRLTRLLLKSDLHRYLYPHGFFARCLF